MADLTENKTATVTDGVADFETIDGSLVKSLVVEIEPSQSGTGTPSPDNIRPISGYTQEDVTVVGKNFLPMLIDNIKVINTVGSWSGNTYSNIGMTYKMQTDGTGSLTGVKVSGTTTSYPVFNLCKCSFPVGTYKYNANGIRTRIYKNEVMIADRTATADDYTLTVDNPTDEYRIAIFTGSVTLSETMVYPILCKSTNDTTFEPYKGKTYSTPFGQTVYGGTLDVLSGELTIDKLYAEFDGSSDEVWTSQSGTSGGVPYFMMSIRTPPVLPAEELAVNNYKSNYGIVHNYRWLDSGNYGISWGYGFRFSLQDVNPNTMTVDEFKTWLSTHILQVVYMIDTPQTIQLPPQKVKSLVGENHIQASTGDVLECKYSMLINGDDLEMLLS
jgi:hypothetical protein